MPALADEEGEAVPAGLQAIDAHTHLFPPRVYDAVWRWFNRHAWPIRYQIYADDVIRFLTERGVTRIVGLHYSHVPEMAAQLNEFAHQLSRRYSQVWMVGTVLPGEPDAEEIVSRALGKYGLRGIKLHCHVQRFAPDEPHLDGIYRVIADSGRPVVIHAGREPSSPAYGWDAPAHCSAAAMQRVLKRHPRLQVIVPHLGADEFAEYGALLEQHDNLWLDTTMMFAGYFPEQPPAGYVQRWAHRLLYGSDFPHVPYAWDRELKHLAELALSPAQQTALFSGNAQALFG